MTPWTKWNMKHRKIEAGKIKNIYSICNDKKTKKKQVQGWKEQKKKVFFRFCYSFGKSYTSNFDASGRYEHQDVEQEPMAPSWIHSMPILVKDLIGTATIPNGKEKI